MTQRIYYPRAASRNYTLIAQTSQRLATGQQQNSLNHLNRAELVSSLWYVQSSTGIALLVSGHACEDESQAWPFIFGRVCCECAHSRVRNQTDATQCVKLPPARVRIARWRGLTSLVGAERHPDVK